MRINHLLHNGQRSLHLLDATQTASRAQWVSNCKLGDELKVSVEKALQEGSDWMQGLLLSLSKTATAASIHGCAKLSRRLSDTSTLAPFRQRHRRVSQIPALTDLRFTTT